MKRYLGPGKIKIFFVLMITGMILPLRIFAQDTSVPLQYESSQNQTLENEVQKYSYVDLLFSLRQNNPEIQTALEEYNCSILDLNDAKASMGPSVDLQFTGTYMNNSLLDGVTVNVDDIINSIQWGDSYKPSSTGQYVKVFDGIENTYYALSLSLMQPIFTWGKLSEAVRIYGKIVDVKQLQLLSVQKKLETQLEARLVTLDFLYRILDVIQEEKEYAQRLVSYSENAEQSGMVIHQDVLEARIQALELDIAVQDLDEQIKSQLLELSRITGIDNLEWDNIDFKVDLWVVDEILSEDRSLAMEKALSPARDTIRILDQLQEIKGMAEKIAAAYVNWKPDVALQIDAGYGGSRFPLLEPNWYRKDDFNFTLSVGIKTTIWDGGKKLNDVSRKVSEAKTAELTRDDTVAQIKQQLQSLWNAIDVCTLRMEYQDLKMETCQSKIRQQELVYNSGYGSEMDLLSAKIDYCNQKIERLRQELERAAACYSIYFFLK